MRAWDASPSWVLIGLQVQHVSDFANLAPRDRPVVRCPECLQDVILKLGQERAHHFAHKPDANGRRCRLEDPLAAKHSNALYHLKEQLDPSRCHELKVYSNRGEPTVFARDWDQVILEYKIGTRRADVALLRQGQPIALIEVFVSHEVDLDKNDDLDDAGIPWIEVSVFDLGLLAAPGSRDFDWTAQLALPVRQGTPYYSLLAMTDILGPDPAETIADIPTTERAKATTHIPSADSVEAIARLQPPARRLPQLEPLETPRPLEPGELPPRLPHDDTSLRAKAREILATGLQGRDHLLVTEPDIPWQTGGTRIFVDGWDQVEVGKIVNLVRVDLTFSRSGADIAYLMMYAGEPMWGLPRHILNGTGVPWAEGDIMATLWPGHDGESAPVWEPDQPIFIRPTIPGEGRLLSKAQDDEARLVHQAAALAHLVAQLQGASALAIALPSSPTHEVAPLAFVHGWDEVCADYVVNGITAHVALLHGGEPLAFIQIQTAYRLDHKMLSDLDQLGYDWIEVADVDILGADGDAKSAWTSDQRLNIWASSPICDRNRHPRPGRD